MSYENWKIKKSEFEEKQNEYSQVAAWCNEFGKYTIQEIDDEYCVVKIPEPKPLTKEEVEDKRRILYIQLVDPKTSHINRLKDEEQTDEIITKIETLKIERSQLIKQIKEENPYPNE